MAIGIRLAPRAGTQVAFGVDPSAPECFLVRGRLLRPSAALALLLLFFLARGRLGLLREGDWLTLALASLLAWSAVAVALLRKRLVLDRRRGLLSEELGLLFPFARRSRPLAAFRRVLVSADNQPGSEGRQTVYSVDLDASAGAAPGEAGGAGATRLRVDSAGLWEGAMPLAESLARFLGLPLRDERRRGELGPDRLDVAFRERDDPETRLFPPKRARCRIEVERPYLFRARIPRPAVPQTLLLNGGVAVSSLLPLAFQVLIPLLRGQPVGSARELAVLTGWCLLPILVVGSASLLALAGNGGTIAATPECLRFLRNGLLGPTTVEIPAAELEDLVVLEPEIGGERSLLAYFSEGVLVARSDRVSFRFGYGLDLDELLWLRQSLRDVLLAGVERRAARAPRETDPEPASSDLLPSFPRWRLAWLGLLAGGLAGRALGGPLGVCVAVPLVEHVLNVGAAIGFLAGFAFSPSLWKHTHSRSGRVMGLVVLAVAAVALAIPNDSIQPRPGSGAWKVASERRGDTGFFLAASVADAVALNLVLWVAFRLRSRRWAVGLGELLNEAADSARRREAAPNAKVVASFACAGLGLVALGWNAAARGPSPSTGPPSVRRVMPASPRLPSIERRIVTAAPPRAFPTLVLPPGLPPVEPRIELAPEPGLELSRLAGRPVLLLYWGPRGLWLPDVDRLQRAYATRLEVIGIPHGADTAAIEATLRSHRIGWRQFLDAGAWAARVPVAWPQVALLGPSGVLVHRGSPGRAVDDQVAALLGEAEAAPMHNGLVEGRLLYAGRPLHETGAGRARFWFRDEWRGVEARVQVSFDARTSEFRWVAASGTLLASLSAGGRIVDPPHVSYTGGATFSVGAGAPQRIDFSLERILRLRAPVDTGQPLPPHGQYLSHRSPVRFEWEPVVGATSYRYWLHRMDVDGSSEAVSGETERADVELTLDPGRYELRLQGSGPTGLLARLEVHGANYRGWSYGFRVE